MAKQQRDTGTSLVVYEKRIEESRSGFLATIEKNSRKLNFQQEQQFALQLFRESAQLQKCDVDSVGSALIDLAAMGLSLNKTKGQAALIPRWSTKHKKLMCTASPMYRGYLALATGGKHITNVWADVVKVGDEFSYEKGSAPKLTHKIPLRKRGDESGKASPDNVLGAYCCAEIAGSNHVHITWASIDDLLAIADKSEAYSPKPRKGEDGKAYTPKPSGPWVDFFGEMCIKSVIRRAYKTWPLPDTAEYEPLRKAVEVDTQAEIMESAIDVESQEVEGLSSEDQKKIDDAIVAAGIKPEKVEAFLANIICKSYGIETIADLRPDLVAEVIKRIADYGAKLKAKAS